MQFVSSVLLQIVLFADDQAVLAFPEGHFLLNRTPVPDQLDD